MEIDLSSNTSARSEPRPGDGNDPLIFLDAKIQASIFVLKVGITRSAVTGE